MNQLVDATDIRSLLDSIPKEFSAVAAELKRYQSLQVTRFEGGALGFCPLRGVTFSSSQNWLHLTYPGVAGGPYDHFTVKFASEEMFAELGAGREFVFDIPLEFSRFLDVFNGMSFFAGGLVISGFDGETRYAATTASIYEPYAITWDNTHLRPGNLPRKYVVIGHYFHSGFSLCWDSEADVVCAIRESEAKPVVQWNDFVTFCDQEIPRIRSLLPDDLMSLHGFPVIKPGGYGQ